MIMSIKFKALSGTVAVFMVLAISGFAVAQEQAPQGGVPKMEGKGPGQGRFGKRGHGKRKGMRAPGRRMGPGGIMQQFRGLNLSDAQRQQIRGIMESNRPSDAVREEMRSIAQARRNGTVTDAQKARAKELAEQGRANMENVRQQTLAVLTAEQKAELDSRRQKMEDRRKQMDQRRKECKDNPGTCQGPGMRGMKGPGRIGRN
jgi:Spy/CpxP family protein refolding chaperone